MERRRSGPNVADQTQRVLMTRIGGQSTTKRGPDFTLRERRPLYVVACVLVLLSVLLRQPLLVVAGILVAVIAAVPEIWYRFGLNGLLVSRVPVASQAMLGDEVEVVVTFENRQPLPLPWVEVEDDYPAALPVVDAFTVRAGAPERMIVPEVLGIWAYQRVRRRHHVRCEMRGAWRLGPLTVRLTDPFAILTREAVVHADRYLIVYPLVAPIERFGLPAQSPFGEQKSPVRLLEDPLRVAGIRPYQYGDEPRRIHWKATARSGSLQSKMYDPSTRHTLALFLDVRTYQRALYGYDPLLSELAICAAASVAHWALEHGYAVGLYANGTLVAPELDTVAGPGASSSAAASEMAREVVALTGAQGAGPRAAVRLLGPVRLRIPAASNPAQLSRVLDGLARLLPYGGLPMEQVLAGELGRLPLGASVVYIGAEAAVDVPLIVALRRAQSSGHPVTLLLTENAPDGGDSGGADSTHAMHLAGLTAHRIGGRDTWTQLASEVLGREVKGESDGEPASDTESTRGGRRDGVRYAQASRALRIE
jgi:uncharacterized protein (DUF58 family)